MKLIIALFKERFGAKIVTKTKEQILAEPFDEKFVSYVVSPINTLEEGIKVGNYSQYFLLETNPIRCILGMERIPKQPKRVYLIPLDQSIHLRDSAVRLKTLGKKLCEHAPNYMLGLMASVSETQFPESLKNTNILAGELERKTSLFKRLGVLSYLIVGRHDYLPKFGGSRSLNTISVDFMFTNPGWVVLAEDI